MFDPVCEKNGWRISRNRFGYCEAEDKPLAAERAANPIRSLAARGLGRQAMAIARPG